MSIYDNETTSKFYPDLSPTAPQESQTYYLKKLTEIEAYLLDEIEVRERIAKKWNDSIQPQPSKTSTVITGEISMAVFANGLVYLLALP